MINLGVVLAVDKYQQLGELPGCLKDGEVMAKALTMENRFSDVLVIRNNANGATTKTQLIEFINKHTNEEIGDFVFYFTGHGEFYGNDFYHLLPDYDAKKRQQTALQNSELDSLIRNLKPALCIKMIDACHSGTSYIKDRGELEEHLKSTQNAFNKLYFMYSSQSDQRSFQNKHLSFFTRAIAEALIKTTSLPVRYKDVIDYVSDAFSAKALQTPYFVTQAGFTEPFCSPSDSLRAEIAELLKEDQPTRKKQVPEAAETLLTLVTKDAESYCSEKEAIDGLGTLAKSIGDIKLSEELTPLYGARFLTETSNDVPKASQIAEWLDKDTSEPAYLVKVQYETREVTRRVRKSPFMSSFSNLFAPEDESEFTTRIEQKEFATNFQSNVDLPYRFLCVLAEPKYPNLYQAKCFVVPVLSRNRLRVFWTYASYDFANWNDRKVVKIRDWTTDEVLIKGMTSLDAVIDRISTDFSSFILEPIKSKLLPRPAAKK